MNIVIYFVVGGIGNRLYMVVQTALVHPTTKKNIQLAKSLSVVKIFLSAFYWSSLLCTGCVVLNSIFCRNHILAKTILLKIKFLLPTTSDLFIFFFFFVKILFY